MAVDADWIYKFEILVLGCFLFYADVVSDVVSLAGFWHRGQKWFFWINLTGIGLNMVASGVFGILESRCTITGFFMGFFQLHPFLRARDVLSTGQKLQDKEATVAAIFRSFELVESCCSVLVQGYVVVWDASLSGSNELMLQASVIISLLSLANGLVMLDKTPEANEHGANVTSMVSVSFVFAFAHRVFELIVSYGSLFLFQLATRPYGGYVVLTVVLVCMLIVMGVRMLNGVMLDVADRLDVKVFFFVGTTILLAVPLCFFHASPALGAPSRHSPVVFCPPRLHYFVFRMATIGLMLAYLIFRAGSFGAIWDFWTPYNASATFLAHAVGVSLIAYTTTFLLAWCCSRDERYHSLLSE